MAALMPSDHGELSMLCDAGRESEERYGSAFLKAIKDHGAGRLDGSLGDDPGQSQSSADGGVLKRAFLLKQEMNVLKERLDRLSKEHEECIRDALQMEVEVEGEYRMEKVVRMIREVDVALFRKAYPSEFLELAVVHVGAAEKAIGRKELGPLLKARERTYYHVVKRE
jgi:hypothetical protein